MDRNIALELVRITETAALASANYMGRGDKNAADGAAVEGMRVCFESVDVRGEIVIAYALYRRTRRKRIWTDG